MALDGKHLADQYSKSYGFKVDITGGGGADTNEGAWRSVRGGGIRVHEAGGCTTGQDQFKNHTRGICEWDDLVLAGAVTKDRKQMLEWYKAMQEKGKDADCYKDVSVTLINREGGDVYTINFLECFLTSYSLCPLNGEEDDVEAQETVEIQVGYSDNFLS
jgi:phage tail-like protein